ncbi:hypothetical protein ZL39_002156 [Salmonella enterica subsp. enterica]|nr:hypothetical protein [Salmonella enterica subsp. enterica serovar Lexington]
MCTLLSKFRNGKIKMYRPRYKNRMIDDNEYEHNLRMRMENLLNQYNQEVKSLTHKGVTNLGFGYWDNGESIINNHSSKITEILEKMQSTQVMMDMLSDERQHESF